MWHQVFFMNISNRDGQLNKKKKKKFWFHLHTMKLQKKFFRKPKSFSLVLSLLSDHIQGNTVEKDFQILIKFKFINIYKIVRGKD